MLRKVAFYSHFHNGDIFISKGYVQAIMRAYPGIDYIFALGVHPSVADYIDYKAAVGTKPDAVKDLRCEMVTIDKLPDFGWYQRLTPFEGGFLVNTWVGAYKEALPPGEVHANYRSLQRMWTGIFEDLNSAMGLQLRMPADPLDAVPTTDWSVYNCTPADEYLAAHPCAKRLLFCNGPVMSDQSVWGDDDMRSVIEALAEQHPDWDLVCTRKFDTHLPNVHFTDDIFRQSSDLNEIGYLSTHCDLIWGKVSGPFMFCQVRENMFNPDIIFFACSDRPSDSLPYGCEGLGCRYYHALTDDPQTMIAQINQVIMRPDPDEPVGSMVVLP